MINCEITYSSEKTSNIKVTKDIALYSYFLMAVFSFSVKFYTEFQNHIMNKDILYDMEERPLIDIFMCPVEYLRYEKYINKSFKY